jgi:hypothetical protein
VTPVPAAIARPLAQGLRNKVICRENRIRKAVPQTLLSCREAIRLALRRDRRCEVETCWSDAGCPPPPEWVQCGDTEYAGGTVLECGMRAELAAPPPTVWNPIIRIGGRTGWYFGNALWRVRGMVDKLAGGVGLARGRRDPGKLQVGDAIDFWRVQDMEHPRLLQLQAEMKMPGEAVLEFHLKPVGSSATELTLLARFRPRGLVGLVYWFTLFPFHEWIFGGMIRAIARVADARLVSTPRRFTPKVPQECRLEPTGSVRSRGYRGPGHER